jgi:small-conductance mechanosensitive channel
MSKDILIGDDIEVSGIDGTVEKITIRTTSIRRYDGALVLVPNSIILNEPVIDYSATPRRRVEVRVVMGSDVDIETATEALKAVGEGETRRIDDTKVVVLTKGFDASIVTLELRFWVLRSDLTTVKSDVHGTIQREFRDRGLSLDISTTINVTGGDHTK